MRLYSLLLFLFIPGVLPVLAQHHDIDSLAQVAELSASDTSRVNTLNLLAAELREIDNDRAMKYAGQAKELATLLDYTRGRARALENIGWISYRQCAFSQAFDTSTEALKLAEGLNDVTTVVKCLNTLAAVRIEQHQISEGVALFKKAYSISHGIGDRLAMARCINNISYCFLQNEQIDSAARYATLGLHLAEDAGSRYMMGFALRTLGDVDMARGKHHEALAKFAEIVRIAKALENMFLMVSTNHRVGKVYYILGRNAEALTILKDNMVVARKYEFRSELERSLRLISEIHAAKGEMHRAYDFQSQYLAVHDSLQQQRGNEQMALMQARYDSEMKEASIALLTKEAELRKEEINTQRLWMYFSIGCLSLMVILAFVLLYSNRLKKRANDQLASKNREIEEKSRELAGINVTKDKLFSIVSHDLRSPLASLRGLVTVMGAGGLSKEEFVESSRKLRKNLEAVQDDLDNLLVWAQSQMNGLQSNPTVMRMKPVVDEKADLFSESAYQKNITIVNDVDESISIVADRNHMRLVIRNLLANAIKFNRPGGSISVRARAVGDFYEFSVSDSGIGMTDHDLGRLFNAATHFSNPGTSQEKGAGIGLLLTREFVEKGGGTIRATSEFGKGSTFIFTVKRDVRQSQMTDALLVPATSGV